MLFLYILWCYVIVVVYLFGMLFISDVCVSSGVYFDRSDGDYFDYFYKWICVVSIWWCYFVYFSVGIFVWRVVVCCCVFWYVVVLCIGCLCGGGWKWMLDLFVESFYWGGWFCWWWVIVVEVRWYKCIIV